MALTSIKSATPLQDAARPQRATPLRTKADAHRRCVNDNPLVVNIRPVRGQHTVTERLLKGFAGSHGRLAVFDRAYRQRRLLSPGAGIFTIEFDSWDSRGTEDLWNLFETRFPSALAQVESRTALGDSATVGTLKDILALHWLRSRAMMEARKQAAERFFARYRRHAPDARRDELAEALREQSGIIAASRSALEWTTDRLIEDAQTNDVARWHSEWNSRYFAAARTRFEGLEMQIHHTAAKDLVVGDSPVITTIEGVAGAGPHQGVGIQKADHVAMPITPNVLITLGVTHPATDLEDDDVDRYNELQWLTYVTWIAARPEGTADERLKHEAER